MKKSKIVTITIVFLITLFAVLLASNFIRTDKPQTAAVREGPSGGPAGGPPGGPLGQAQGAGGNAPGGNTQGGQRTSSRNATAVRVTPVEPGTIEKSVIINGDVLARNQVSIFPNVGGKLAAA
ncbi:MAG: hypothetical protein LBG91_05295, partial [Treponema sp.]|nr:hypothetical protein [Treponema sp.]